MRLSLDTSTSLTSVALDVGEKILVHSIEQGGGSHDQSLSEIVNELVASAGIELSDLTVVRIGLGPGSFTGLRIGLGFAKGLVYGLGIALEGVHSFWGYLDGVPSDCSEAVCFLDARRGEVFRARFGRNLGVWSSFGVTELVSRNELADEVFGGGKVPSHRVFVGGPLEPKITDEAWQISTLHPARGLLAAPDCALAASADTRSEGGFPEVLSEIQPFYLRAVAAKTIAERTPGP